MKPLNIFFFSLLYFLVYLAVSLGIESYFGLQTNFAELLLIGSFFNVILVVLLVFDVPEKIAEKFEKKEEKVLFYITDDVKDDKDAEELLEVLKENATKIVDTSAIKTPTKEDIQSENQVKTEEREEKVY